jgi:transcriptional regulator GlxA family with amidase domain
MRRDLPYMKRPGGQSQFSELLQSQTTGSSAFDELHLWIAKNLQDQKLTVDMLAAHVNMSPRNFARSYKTQAGRTPAKALELFRVEAARRLLEEATLNVDRSARSCGFGHDERMRATFKRHLAVSPRDYRRRFSILSSTSAMRRCRGSRLTCHSTITILI